MKRICFLFTFGFAMILTDCNHNDTIAGDDNKNGTQGGIHIRGRVTGLQKGNTSHSLLDAKKVLLYSQYYYRLVDIAADTFSVTAEFRSGVALIFLDDSNKYIGHLSPRGVNVLPLGNLSNGINTTIDLSTLQLIGNTVIPARDPFGNAIQISDEELQSLKIADGYFESIAKNIDSDNDGIPDVLANKQVVFTTHYGMYGGHWGHNDTIPAPVDSSDRFVGYGLEVGGGSALTFYAGNISFTGPSQDPSSDIILWGMRKAPQCGGNRGFIASFNRWDGTYTHSGPNLFHNFRQFKKGKYTLTLDWTNKYNLEYTCVDMKYNLLIITPTLHTDSLGRLTSITFQYKLPDGKPINPSSVLSDVMVQLSNKLTGPILDARINTSSSSTDFTTLTMDVPVDISNLGSILVSYNDLAGNFYGISWN
jgi:hypothetical protein